MEVDGGLEVGAVAIASGQALDLLHLGVHRLLEGVGDPVSQVGQDVVESALEGASHGGHRRQTAVGGPAGCTPWPSR